MALFIVRHQHAPEHCPAADAQSGATLLNYLSSPNVRKHGIELRGEAIVQGEHTMYIILEAKDEALVRDFMQPFAAAGSVDIYPAATCAGVVSNGGCAADSIAHTDEAIVDPEEACQQALDHGLLVHRANPLNCEASLSALIGGVVMPNQGFYTRNHFPIPKLDSATWRLRIGGLVERPLSLSIRDLMNLPSQTRTVTLECAGNGRAMLQPRTKGEPWQLGAVSTAEWTGVPLTEVLDRVGVIQTASDIVFRGADHGTPEGLAKEIYFERSLSVNDARNSDALLAYAMNGAPLPLEHGFPLRVIVPGWYAVAAVKWLSEIEAVPTPLEGHYQTVNYVFEWQRDGQATREPVTLVRVRSLITDPLDNAEVKRGEIVVRGVAWSGSAPIARVDVRVGDGLWQQARLVGERKRGSWQWWELTVTLETLGSVDIYARATDMASRVQPEHPEWNRLGYGNNMIQRISLNVLD